MLLFEKVYSNRIMRQYGFLHYFRSLFLDDLFATVFYKIKLFSVCFGVFNTVFLVLNTVTSSKLSCFSLEDLQSKLPVLFFSCSGGKESLVALADSALLGKHVFHDSVYLGSFTCRADKRNF